MFEVFLPVAEIDANFWTTFFAGLCSGVVGRILGVGGNFIGTLILMGSNIDSIYAVSSYMHQMVSTSSFKFTRHKAQQKIDFKLGFITLISLSGGGIFGFIILHFFLHPGILEIFAKISYALTLIFILGCLNKPPRFKKSGTSSLSPTPRFPADLRIYRRNLIYINGSKCGIRDDTSAYFFLGL